jgi:hypothetical protein
VLGDYVFYSSDDERVQGHLDEFFMQEETKWLLKKLLEARVKELSGWLIQNY